MWTNRERSPRYIVEGKKHFVRIQVEHNIHKITSYHLCVLKAHKNAMYLLQVHVCL